MRHYEEDTLEFPKTWFWLAQILGVLAIFAVGIKIGKRRRLTIPGMAFDFLRMLAARR